MNPMKVLTTLVLCCTLSLKSLACGWYNPEEVYYNLFLQEIIGDARYFPFLFTYDNFYYASEDGTGIPNENIESWQKHLNISYDQAYYLVFRSKDDSLQALLKGQQSEDTHLSFIDKQFIKAHRQDLEYLIYAKYLEPYMAHRVNQDNTWDNHYAPIDDLDAGEVTRTLIKSWKKAKAKSLKLRYGYQLVRFAHYTGAYEDALNYFQTYVAALDFRPIMYYYALDQRAGAQRALGQYMEANAGFFSFFTHTNNRKENAYTSMRVTQDLDFERLLKEAKTSQARNDIYLLLGFRDFNNPLSSIDRITAEDPNAVQAKVLMARAVNQLERKFLQIRIYCPYYTGHDCLLGTDHRLPLNTSEEGRKFLANTLQTAKKQIANPALKDKDFWQLTLAYLQFLDKDLTQSKLTLAQVKQMNPEYKEQIHRLEMLIDIATPSRITPELEERWAKTYPEVFTLDQVRPYENSTQNFIIDILANRYYLQGDRVKAFLIQNHIDALENNPDMTLLDGIEALYKKSHPTAFEQLLIKNITPQYIDYNYTRQTTTLLKQTDFDFDTYVGHMRGSVALAKGDFKDALEQFKRVDPDFKLWRYTSDYDQKKETWVTAQRSYDSLEFNGYDHIPASIFGSSETVCFSCTPEEVMDTHLIAHFPFIKAYMNKKALTEALLNLQRIGNAREPLAAEANLLISNFLFNTSTLGYFREVLTYNLSNGNDVKYRMYDRQYINYFPIYYKDYTSQPDFRDDFSKGLAYAKKALTLSEDPELKAQILFTAAKYEQGTYYQVENQADFEKQLEEAAGEKLSYSDFYAHKNTYKVEHYRSYFDQLRAYSNTKYYQKLRSNCLAFDYYVTHF